MLLSGGSLSLAASESSQPTTAKSRPATQPFSRSPCIRPMAMRSFAAKPLPPDPAATKASRLLHSRFSGYSCLRAAVRAASEAPHHTSLSDSLVACPRVGVLRRAVQEGDLPIALVLQMAHSLIAAFNMISIHFMKG